MMKYTKESPKEPGWYWLKHGFHSRVVHVTRRMVDDKLMAEVYWVEGEKDPALQFDLEWAGPIKEPK